MRADDDRTSQRAADACAAARLRASLLLDGHAVGTFTRAELDRHLARCPACTRAVARMRLATHTLRAAPLEAPSRRLRLVPGCSVQPAGWRGWSNRTTVRRLGAAAATVVVAFGAASATMLDPTRPNASDETIGATVGDGRAPALPIGQRLALDDFVDRGYGLLVR